MPRYGAVAGGGTDTVAAAVAVLRAGGNAVDAAVAAGFASAVAEPALSSLGGGGFLLTAPADGGPERLLDFFVDSPGRGRDARAGAPTPLPVTLRFAGADQVFHAGWGSVAVPGCLDGYLHAARTLGRLPLAQVVAPAAALARRGAVLDAAQAALLALLADILTLTREGREVFAPQGRVLRVGERLRNPALADLLDDVGRGTVTGIASLAAPLLTAAERAGARLSADDLGAYEVVQRPPLRAVHRDAEVVTNAPPSFGGALVLAALQELAPQPPCDGSAPSVVRLADALTRMSERHASAPQSVRGTGPTSVRGTGPTSVRGTGPTSVRGTTHVSVVDGDGALAAMTLSNGSCSGVFVPGTGVQLNNVMGEADLHPHGSATPAGLRIGSMMAPTLLRTGDGVRTALGSGGSERIRSALLCTLTALVDRRASLDDAVTAPRLHWDRRVLQVEPGLPDEALAALRAGRPVHPWAQRDLYFGGVHAVSRRPDGSVDAAGDARRAGVAAVVPLD